VTAADRSTELLFRFGVNTRFGGSFAVDDVSVTPRGVPDAGSISLFASLKGIRAPPVELQTTPEKKQCQDKNSRTDQKSPDARIRRHLRETPD
jgi:hypothetical protein